MIGFFPASRCDSSVHAALREEGPPAFAVRPQDVANGVRKSSGMDVSVASGRNIDIGANSGSTFEQGGSWRFRFRSDLCMVDSGALVHRNAVHAGGLPVIETSSIVGSTLQAGASQ